MSDAMQTPLIELMRRVPQDARGVYEHHSTSHSFIPYGRYCHEAADIIATQQARMAELEAKIERMSAKGIEQLLFDNAELREALDTLSLVVGLTPIAGNKEALQEALDIARAALQGEQR